MSLSKQRVRMDAIVWALVHANTPGSVDESTNEIIDRVMLMRCSAGSADAMEYWGGRLLCLHENPAPALDECALALAMSQHAELGAESSAAALGPDLLESIFGLVRAEAAALAARAREARCALWTCCIHTSITSLGRARAEMRVLHFLQAHARDPAHFVRACDALGLAENNKTLCPQYNPAATRDYYTAYTFYDKWPLYRSGVGGIDRSETQAVL
jgi:hypothetical protein